VTSGGIDEILGWLTGMDHEAVGELHALRTSGTQLSRDDNLATLSTTLHDESEDTIACSADGKTVEELVSEGLALGDSGETTVLDLSGVEGDGVLWELESLLDEGGKFADSSTLLSENFLGVCCADDDVGDCGCNSDLNTRVSLLSQLALEELVQLSEEDTIGHELASLGDRSTRNGRGHIDDCMCRLNLREEVQVVVGGILVVEFKNFSECVADSEIVRLAYRIAKIAPPDQVTILQ